MTAGHSSGWSDGEPPLEATRRLAPGAVSLPGGHVDPGEPLEDALHRELDEELGVVAERVAYVCTLLHRSVEFRKLHYFAVEGWRGEILNQENVGEYLRLSRSD